MKHLKTLLFASLLFVGATSFTTAQTKIAHVDVQELILSMPQMKTAQAEIEKLTKTYEVQIKEMATELQNKMKQYQAEVDTKTEEENAARAQEVQTMEQSIRQYQGQAQQDLQKKEADLIKPIQDKAIAAINKVAKAQGFQYVLDKSMLLLADGKDLLIDIKKELGI